MLLANRPSTQPPLRLRPYQHEVLRDIDALMDAKINSILLYSPTGSGKTAIAAKIIADGVRGGWRVLVLIHRDELVEQTQEELAVYGIKAGVIKAGYKEERLLPVQIASLQTLDKRELPPGFDLIVVDEAHTTAFWKVFQKIKKFYSPCGIPSMGDVVYLGLTATPWRSAKGEYNGVHFDSIVKAPSIRQLIEQEYLVLPVHMGFGGLVDMSKLELSKDQKDYTLRSMKAAVAHPDFNNFIISKFKQHAKERSAIAFCVSVRHSQKLAEDFNEAGIKAVHIDGTTPTVVRKFYYDGLKRQEIQVICSINALTEGFNIKSIDAVILARPTNSLGLLRQMAGRGLRLSPETDKKDCYLLDFCHNFARHGRIDEVKEVSLCIDEQSIGKKSVKGNEFPYKECPECSTMVTASTAICPDCGHQFPLTKKMFQLPADPGVEPFGILLNRDEKNKALYYRKRLRECYENWKDPNEVVEEFYYQFRHFPPNEWRKGALFRGEISEENAIKYVNYLDTVRPKATKEWFRYELFAEFGQPKEEEANSKEEMKTSLADLDIDGCKWYQILSLDPETCTWEEVQKRVNSLDAPYFGKNDNESKAIKRRHQAAMLSASTFLRAKREKDAPQIA